jgi:hypothetical protein
VLKIPLIGIQQTLAEQLTRVAFSNKTRIFVVKGEK